MRGRIVLGAAAWVATALQWVVQGVVASRWDPPYSWTNNAISDLGVTTCGTFDEQGRQVREVCSPAHALFNGSLVVTGLLLLIGAVLLAPVWPRRRTGIAAMAAVAVSGVLVAVVGFTPWDADPDLHDLAALGQAVVQWVALVLVIVACARRRSGVGSSAGSSPGGSPAGGSPAAQGRERPWPLIAAVSLVVLVVSVAGLVGFLAGLEGADLPLGWGVWERLAFESLTAWAALVGLLLLLRRRRPAQER